MVSSWALGSARSHLTRRPQGMFRPMHRSWAWNLLECSVCLEKFRELKNAWIDPIGYNTTRVRTYLCIEWFTASETASDFVNVLLSVELFYCRYESLQATMASTCAACVNTRAACHRASSSTILLRPSISGVGSRVSQGDCAGPRDRCVAPCATATAPELDITKVRNTY